MIRVTKHDNVISNHDDITCILDLYEEPNFNIKKINELVILQNMYTYSENQHCLQLDTSYLQTARLTVKFTAKDQDQQMIIDKVMITLDIFICAEGRDRTADPCFFRAMLYQLSYLGNSSILY